MTVWTDTGRLDLALALLGASLIAGHAWPATLAAGARRGAGRRVGDILAALVVTAAALLPWLGPWTLAAAAAAATLHGILDRGGTAENRDGLSALLRSQAWHLAAAAAAWFVLTRAPRTAWWPLLVDDPDGWARGAAALGVLAAVLRGGIVVTAGLLDRFPSLPFDPDTARMGRTIGVLERALVLLLVVLDQWGAVGLVIAAKSLARFEDLKRRHFAEYYLIGTLSSLLLACLGGLAMRLLLRS
jgi:hypothetical protein